MGTVASAGAEVAAPASVAVPVVAGPVPELALPELALPELALPVPGAAMVVPLPVPASVPALALPPAPGSVAPGLPVLVFPAPVKGTGSVLLVSSVQAAAVVERSSAASQGRIADVPAMMFASKNRAQNGRGRVGLSSAHR
jgi:hypothetical protein